MLPAVLRHDPGLVARPQLRRVMEGWWAGALWDPREPGVADFTHDFTSASSTALVLSECRAQGGRSEPLVAAALGGDAKAVEWLLAQGAPATHALHTAIRASAEPAMIGRLAAWSSDLNSWMPEPVVVAWARHLCETASRQSALNARCHAMERLDVLLAAGADVNAVSRGCEAPLHLVARRLRALWEATPRTPRGSRVASSAAAKAEEEEALLNGIWHNLVARGADATMLDSEGLAAVELLSPLQCRELLASKRGQYGLKLYRGVRLLGQDPSTTRDGATTTTPLRSEHRECSDRPAPLASARGLPLEPVSARTAPCRRLGAPAAAFAAYCDCEGTHGKVSWATERYRSVAQRGYACR